MKVFTTAGRMNRTAFFWVMLPIHIMFAFLTSVANSDVVISVLEKSFETKDFAMLYSNGVAALIYLFLAMFPISQRFHDIGLSAAYTILQIVPVANVITLVLLFFWRGTDGPNKYGTAPGAVGTVGSSGNLVEHGNQSIVRKNGVTDSLVVSPAKVTVDNLHEKLKELRTLYEQGLLDESVYKKKQAELLENL